MWWWYLANSIATRRKHLTRFSLEFESDLVTFIWNIMVIDGCFFTISSDAMLASIFWVENVITSSFTSADDGNNSGLDGDDHIDTFAEVKFIFWDSDRLIRTYIAVAWIVTILMCFQQQQHLAVAAFSFGVLGNFFYGCAATDVETHRRSIDR